MEITRSLFQFICTFFLFIHSFSFLGIQLCQHAKSSAQPVSCIPSLVQTLFFINLICLFACGTLI